MHPILQIVFFVIVIAICIFGMIKPDRLLNIYYRWRIKHDKEYTKAYVMSVKIVSSVIGIASIGGIINAIIALIN